MRHDSNFHFLISHLPILGIKLIEHIYLAISSTLLAILIGVPLGLWITRHKKFQTPVLAITSIFQTIPSLALLAFLVPLLGIGVKPTIVTLTIYALLPITRNTFTGIKGIPDELIEAARGLGFTRNQRLFKIELPLALPVMIAGIRTATAMTIGITTIAAFIGAGGLGDFITEGLSLNNTKLILLGAIPSALLALFIDYIIAQFESYLSIRKRKTMKLKKIKLLLGAIILCAFIGYAIFLLSNQFFGSRKNTIIIGSKNFTEQYILADMMAELLRAKTKLHVKTKLNLGTTLIAQNALVRGEIDTYPEYTGTAYLVVLHYKKVLPAKETFDVVKKEYKNRFELTWLKPFGFNNSETLAVTQSFAKSHNLTTLSDLASISPSLILAAPAEFLKRPDGLPGLRKTYHLRFKKIIQMQPELMFEAIKNGNVEIIEVFTTDGRIQAFHLKPLIDNKHFYPPYYAAAVIRDSTLKMHPIVGKVLNELGGLINDDIMRNLNRKVTIDKLTPRTVAHNFLVEKGLIKS